MTDLFDRASEKFQYCCVKQPRYRLAWLVGPPVCGKSILARQLCEHFGWAYLNYTLTSGYFDTLNETISSYQPANLIDALKNWCQGCATPVLVVDEIDAVLATWDHQQRYTWAALASRLQWLPCGVVVVSHFFEHRSLADYLPDHDQRYCLDLAGEIL